MTEAKGRRQQQRMRWLDSITNSMNMNLSELWKIVKNRGVWHVAVHGVARNQIRLRDVTTTTISMYCICFICKRKHLKVKGSQSWPTLRPHGLYSSWNSPGQNIGVSSLSLLQGISPVHCRWILHQLSHKGSPRILEWVAYPFSRGSSGPRDQNCVSYISSFGRPVLYQSHLGIPQILNYPSISQPHPVRSAPPPTPPTHTPTHSHTPYTTPETNPYPAAQRSSEWPRG